MGVHVLLSYLHSTLMWRESVGGRSTTEEMGQGLVEYALILMFVGVVLVLLLMILGPGLGNIYSNIVETLEQL